MFNFGIWMSKQISLEIQKNWNAIFKILNFKKKIVEFVSSKAYSILI